MESQVIIYNPRDGAEINDIFAKRKWQHGVNTIKKYPQDLADYLLKKYQFLVKVLPEKLIDIKKLMAATYECDHPGCNYVTDDPKKLNMHMLGKHKLTKEAMDEVNAIEVAEPLGVVIPEQEKGKMTPEEMEGIPDTKHGDKDGWYGGGLEADTIGSGMMKTNRKQFKGGL